MNSKIDKYNMSISLIARNENPCKFSRFKDIDRNINTDFNTRLRMESEKIKTSASIFLEEFE